MPAFWTNALDFANLTAKSVPIGADSVLLADSATSPAGQPKQALLSSLPFAPVTGLTSLNVTGATQAMLPSNRYFVNYTGGACELTLPSAAPFGTVIAIEGAEANTAGFVIAQQANQFIRSLDKVTTTGVSGTLTSSTAFDSVVLVCDDTANTGLSWKATCYGNFSGA